MLFRALTPLAAEATLHKRGMVPIQELLFSHWKHAEMLRLGAALCQTALQLVKDKLGVTMMSILTQNLVSSFAFAADVTAMQTQQ